MQNRFITQYGGTGHEQVNKATGQILVDDFSVVDAGRDQLSVFFDTTSRPPDKSVTHLHEFRKTRFSQWTGIHLRESTDPPIRDMYRGVANYQGSADSFMENPLPNWDQGYNDALGEMLDKLRSGDVGSGLDLAVDLAERHQVSAMLKQTVKLVKFVKSFHPKNWANKWLEYQYGWKPLVSSIYGSADAILHRRTSQYARVQGKGKDTFRKQVITNVSGNVNRILTRDHRFRTLMTCEYMPSNNSIQQVLGYTSLNPASLIWELTPYSFVVDWVYDLGGYMRSMESALAFAEGFRSGWLVQGYKDYQHLSMIGQSGSIQANNYVFFDLAGSREMSYKWRAPISSQPFPTPPSFKVDLGSTRLLNAASLLSQFLGKGK